MSAAAFFDAARVLKRELTGDVLSQHDVDALSEVIATWKPATAPLNPTALDDAAAFFASIRKTCVQLTQPQVDGFQALLQAFGVARWPLAWTAYGLSTAWHETAATMQPVKEAYWLSEDWRKVHLHYFPWYGRGFCQLTWEANYKKADTALHLNGELSRNPDLALKPDIAARIIVWGMESGAFTGKSLADYLPKHGPADDRQFQLARYIINGTDKAAVISKEAMDFQSALQAGGWA
jgi:putative chitinase